MDHNNIATFTISHPTAPHSSISDIRGPISHHSVNFPPKLLFSHPTVSQLPPFIAQLPPSSRSSHPSSPSSHPSSPSSRFRCQPPHN